MKKGKITVKHYLDKRINYRNNYNIKIDCYPLYVRLTVKRQNTYFRSEINDSFGPWTEQRFEEEMGYESELKERIELEQKEIEFILDKINVFENDWFKIKGFSKAIARFQMPLLDLLADRFKSILLDELKKTEVNYLVEIVNVDKDYDDIYSTFLSLSKNDGFEKLSTILSKQKELLNDFEEEIGNLFNIKNIENISEDRRFQSIYSFLSRRDVQIITDKEISKKGVQFIKQTIKEEFSALIYELIDSSEVGLMLASDDPRSKANEFDEYRTRALEGL